MKKKNIFYSSVLFLFLLISCNPVGYQSAKKLYNKKNYAGAIEYYDKFLSKNHPTALSTIAEIERAECYYNLGKKAIEKQNWNLAIRFFYLANNSKSDELMDNCYYELIKINKTSGNQEKVIYYYDYILENLVNSEYIPEILYDKIQIYHKEGKNKLAWNNYLTLCNRYEKNSYCDKAQLIIDSFVKDFIAESISQKDESYELALEKLFHLSEYPTSHYDLILLEISNLYFEIALKSIENNDLSNAKINLQSALDYDPSKKALVDQKLQLIADSFIIKGDQFLAERFFSKAKNEYSRAFEVIPDYTPAIEAINKADGEEKKVNEALKYINSAEKFEFDKDYEKALKEYQKAFNLDASNSINEKIFTLKNILEAQKNPIAFATRILKDYKKGKIFSTLVDIQKEITKKYSKNEINISDWKILLSVGEYKYEARYDITTPEENYFFIWQIDLKNRKVTPLNKTTEEYFNF